MLSVLFKGFNCACIEYKMLMEMIKLNRHLIYYLF
jgi:hypothetical protein